MANTERAEYKEKIFDGMEIYFSGSIRGVPNPEPDFAYHLVQHLKNGGAVVLSEHVGARTPEEIDQIFLDRTGIDRSQLEKPWYVAREVDIKWVDQATHLIAIVSSPSLGVGAEIERAILKPQRGLNQTPILCLIQEDLLAKLSWMTRGVSKEECPVFELQTHRDLEDAKTKITEFLAKHK